jgi:RNA polymerase-binding transcription factor
MLRSEDLERVREVLTRLIAQLTEELAALEAGRETVSPDNAIGRLSRLEALNDQGVRNTRIAEGRRRMMALQATVTRLDEDGYGECDACGEDIPLARLELVPESRRCVTCAEDAGT